MTTTTEALPQATPGISSQPRSQPPYHVVLLDDNDHTYASVIEMLRRLFGHEEEKHSAWPAKSTFTDVS